MVGGNTGTDGTFPTFLQFLYARASGPRRLRIGPREVLSFEQKWLSFGFRQCTGEAISEIQFGRMAAHFTEVAIGLTRYASLRFVDRLNRDLRASRLKNQPSNSR